MKLVFLGTSSAFPTADRNHSATFLDIGPEAFLFDCGENTQRQLRIAGISPMKISKVFITHWHGDHVLGLPGLLQSFELNNKKGQVDIYGPEGTKERFHYLRKALGVQTSYKIEVHEAKAGKVFETEDYQIIAGKAIHTIPCLTFAYIEKEKVRLKKEVVEKLKLDGPIVAELTKGKDIILQGKTVKSKDATYVKEGKKISYVIDSAFDEKLIDFAKNSDVLVCEATFDKSLEKEANEKGHMSAKQAGKIALKSKSKQLIITHFSQRYNDTKQLLIEAQKEFKNTIAARDFLEVKI